MMRHQSIHSASKRKLIDISRLSKTIENPCKLNVVSGFSLPHLLFLPYRLVYWPDAIGNSYLVGVSYKIFFWKGLYTTTSPSSVKKS